MENKSTSLAKIIREALYSIKGEVAYQVAADRAETEIRARIASERPGVEVELSGDDLNVLDRAYLDGVLGDHATTSDAWRSGVKAVVAKFLELRTLPPKPEQGGAAVASDAELFEAAWSAWDTVQLEFQGIESWQTTVSRQFGIQFLRLFLSTLGTRNVTPTPVAPTVHRTADTPPTFADADFDGHVRAANYGAKEGWTYIRWDAVCKEPKLWPLWFKIPTIPPAPEPEVSAEEKAENAAFARWWLANGTMLGQDKARLAWNAGKAFYIGETSK